jgi:hypothetical protein
MFLFTSTPKKIKVKQRNATGFPTDHTILNIVVRAVGVAFVPWAIDFIFSFLQLYRQFTSVK